MEFQRAVNEFNTLISAVKQSDAEQFLLWAKETINDLFENLTSQDNPTTILDSIREDIRESLPLECTSKTENIILPVVGPNADCDLATTVHVDGFLYDDDAIDDMCEEGTLSRNYCVNCHSKSVKPLTFITHSLAVPQIKYIYQSLLQDLRHKTVLDVGSRTGAVLYGAYLFSEAEHIVGVELDVTFCELQKKVVEKYNMGDRIQNHIAMVCPFSDYLLLASIIDANTVASGFRIVHSDIIQQADLLQASDVIILNNVFEFFMPVEQQLRIWKYLYETLRKTGSIIITVPSIQESLSRIQAPLDIAKWVQPVDVCALKKTAVMKLYNDTEDHDLDDIHMYQVL